MGDYSCNDPNFKNIILIDTCHVDQVLFSIIVIYIILSPMIKEICGIEGSPKILRINFIKRANGHLYY